MPHALELIDVLNPNGTPAGRTIDKAEAHRTGAWHRAAHVWIVTAEGKLLLQRRSPEKENWPDLWDVSVAGHVSAGETAAEAAVREAREELGLEIDPAELVHFGTLTEQCVLNGGTYLDNEIHELFVLRRNINISALRLDPAEVGAVALVRPDELASYALVPHPGEYTLLSEFIPRAG